MRLATGKCELARVVERHGLANSGALAREVYRVLAASRVCRDAVAPLMPRADNRTECDQQAAELIALRVLALKRLSGHALPETPLRQRVLWSVAQIAAFQRLRIALPTLRRAYNELNADDEAKLEQLWTLLRPDVRRRGGRMTDEWNELGFQVLVLDFSLYLVHSAVVDGSCSPCQRQWVRLTMLLQLQFEQGNNPATDFRAMGVFGLDALLYFARAHPAAARRVCNESLVPHNKWFSFAITHINLAFDAVQWCEREPALVAPAFLAAAPVGVDTFHRFCAVLMVRFHEHWRAAAPPNVMSYQPVHEAFLTAIRGELEAHTFSLEHALLE